MLRVQMPHNTFPYAGTSQLLFPRDHLLIDMRMYTCANPDTPADTRTVRRLTSF